MEDLREAISLMVSTSRGQYATKKFAEDGSPLCSCGCGRPPGKGRRTWHSKECVDAWMLRNNPSVARHAVWKRDRGICAGCGCDASKMFTEFMAVYRAALKVAETMIERIPAPGWFAKWRKEVKSKAREMIGPKWNGWMPHRSTGWDCDHVIPVVEGGGQCGLKDLRTLCHPCHGKATKALMERLRQKNATFRDDSAANSVRDSSTSQEGASSVCA
jgi:5-methylcytosine-specific restriction endonuclease McrA